MMSVIVLGLAMYASTTQNNLRYDCRLMNSDFQVSEFELIADNKGKPLALSGLGFNNENNELSFFYGKYDTTYLEDAAGKRHYRIQINNYRKNSDNFALSIFESGAFRSNFEVPIFSGLCKFIEFDGKGKLAGNKTKPRPNSWTQVRWVDNQGAKLDVKITFVCKVVNSSFDISDIQFIGHFSGDAPEFDSSSSARINGLKSDFSKISMKDAKGYYWQSVRHATFGGQPTSMLVVARFFTKRKNSKYEIRIYGLETDKGLLFTVNLRSNNRKSKYTMGSGFCSPITDRLPTKVVL